MSPFLFPFMPVFSGLRNVPLAAVDILIVLGTIIWTMVAIWPRYRWVAVATVLQLSITWMNR